MFCLHPFEILQVYFKWTGGETGPKIESRRTQKIIFIEWNIRNIPHSRQTAYNCFFCLHPFEILQVYFKWTGGETGPKTESRRTQKIIFIDATLERFLTHDKLLTIVSFAYTRLKYFKYISSGLVEKLVLKLSREGPKRSFSSNATLETFLTHDKLLTIVSFAYTRLKYFKYISSGLVEKLVLELSREGPKRSFSTNGTLERFLTHDKLLTIVSFAYTRLKYFKYISSGLVEKLVLKLSREGPKRSFSSNATLERFFNHDKLLTIVSFAYTRLKYFKYTSSGLVEKLVLKLSREGPKRSFSSNATLETFLTHDKLLTIVSFAYTRLKYLK